MVGSGNRQIKMQDGYPAATVFHIYFILSESGNENKPGQAPVMLQLCFIFSDRGAARCLCPVDAGTPRLQNTQFRPGRKPARPELGNLKRGFIYAKPCTQENRMRPMPGRGCIAASLSIFWVYEKLCFTGQKHFECGRSREFFRVHGFLPRLQE